MTQAKSPTIEQLERTVPASAKAAVKKAYREALASGKPVIVSKDGALHAISADGTSKLIKKIESRTRVKKGAKIVIPD